MDYFLNTLFDQQEIAIGNLQLISEEVIKEISISFNSFIRLLCISPIALLLDSNCENKGKRLILPDIDEFSNLIYDRL